MEQPNQGVKENQEANQPEANLSQSQEEHKPLFGGVDSQGKERLFNTVEEAQQSWQHSQDFIKNTVQEKQSLEAKVQELEAKVNQSLKLEEALEKLQQQKETTQMTQEPNQQQTTEQTSQLDLEQLEAQLTEKIIGKLTASQQEEVFKNNESESISAAQAVFGSDFESKLKEKAQSVNMSSEDIVHMARTNPTLFKNTFGLNKAPSKDVTPPSGSNTPQNNVAPQSQKPAFFGKDRVNQGVEALRNKAREMGLDPNLF